MRAAILRAHGEVPEIAEFDDPAAADGAEVLEVLAGGVNPVDVRIASGTFPNERHEPPYVAGKEGVGRRPDGSLLYFDASVEPYGAFGERTLVEAGSAYPVPAELDPGLAVSLGVSGLAAWVSLEWRGALQPGETVLVLGASGVVGQIAVQAARLLGAGRVVAAARRLEHVSELGADATVQLGEGDVVNALRAAAGGDGFDLALDPLWGEPAVAAIAAMKPFGRLVQMGQSAAAEAVLSSSAVRAKPVDILGYTNYTAGEEVKAAAYARMTEHAAAGELRVDVERVGLEDVPEVWQRVQGGSAHRKLIVVPQEPPSPSRL
jgi:NADPH:quinone reductase-like Zn-dependent oxidoreductase